MKIAYLMAAYPMVSSTFIGREIEALEARGFEVARYAVRRWDGPLSDPRDQAEAARTDYLLEDGAPRLVAGLLAETLANPRGVLRALGLWRRLVANAGGGLVRHAAYFLEAAALRRRLRRAPVAHLHAHFSTNSTTAAMLCRAMGGPAYSFTVHGPDEFFEPRGLSLEMKISNAAFVACISHFCRSQCMIFSDAAHWDRLRIVHCGVDPARYAPDPARPRRAAQGGRILFVGRLSRLKGGAPLIEAFARARARVPGARLSIIGDGDQRPALEALARELGAAEAVEFLGWRDQDQVRAAMAEADILALTSFAEGVPVTLMEAMASGLPVIASRVAGVEELVEDGVSGFVCPAGDVETIAERALRLLEDPALRARMGEAGMARVAAEFDLEAEAAWLGRLIAGTAAGNPPPGLRPQGPGETAGEMAGETAAPPGGAGGGGASAAAPGALS